MPIGGRRRTASEVSETRSPNSAKGRRGGRYTLLSRLREKGYVTSKKDGVAHLFAAAVSREKLLGQRLADLVDRVCDGTASPLVHALVNTRRFSAEEISELRRLVDELESGDAAEG